MRLCLFALLLVVAACGDDEATTQTDLEQQCTSLDAETKAEVTAWPVSDCEDIVDADGCGWCVTSVHYVYGVERWRFPSVACASFPSCEIVE